MSTSLKTSEWRNSSSTLAEPQIVKFQTKMTIKDHLHKINNKNGTTNNKQLNNNSKPTSNIERKRVSARTVISLTNPGQASHYSRATTQVQGTP